ncbi:3-hydroxyacyl-CoA dehydrogenase NAD-binding domain-containing protein [Candidatus Neomarinimicrobiota bacterium]
MITYEIDKQGIVVVTFDQPNEALNILLFISFQQFSDILDEIANLKDPVPAGVVFISDKPDNFIVGADIKDFTFVSEKQAEAASRMGQQIWGKIRALPFPSVAAINGTCMGGGLEMALNCTSRIITDHPKTVLALPEVKLGLIPGTGGSQNLPRLVGVQAALDMLLTGKNIYPYKARKIGLADEIVNPGVLLTAAKTRVLRLARGEARRIKPKRSLIMRALDGPLKSIVYRMARKRVLGQTKGNYPAPLEILGAVRKGLGKSLSKGLEIESKVWGQLSMTAEHRALTHVFFAERTSRHKLVTEPQLISQIGILGGGLMGAGITIVALDKGFTVRQKDLNYDALAKSRGHIQGYFQGRAKKRIITRREADLILTHYSVTTDYTGFQRSQAVIEAVFEDLELKHSIIAELEAILTPDTVIATNTSSLPITKIAEQAKNPERIIGMHFFSPVERMPLLEITVSKHTNDQTLATAVSLGRKLGKTVIVVKDSPGFYINRILTPYLNESMKLLEDGLTITELDRHALRMGFPIGPCAVMDEIGLDVADKVAQVMVAFFGERAEATDLNQRLMEDNRLGHKNERGFYTYVRGHRAEEDKSLYALLDHPQRHAIPYEEVRERLLSIILHEAAHVLEEGIIDNPYVGDTGAIYGFGFPPFLGGPFWAMDRIGLPAFVEQLQRLAEQHGPRFTPAAGLIRRAEQREAYYD